jgi:hypothetical protein
MGIAFLEAPADGLAIAAGVQKNRKTPWGTRLAFSHCITDGGPGGPVNGTAGSILENTERLYASQGDFHGAVLE